MKSLTLLRHAKSAWDDPVARDFDRPLNPRGRRAARAVGEKMRREGLAFDLVLASPARRVVETLDEVSAVLGALPVSYDARIYLAPPSILLDIVHEAGDAADRLMLVGHNPGLETLALNLTRRGDGALRAEMQAKYPTGTLAEIRLDVARWREVEENRGTLERFIRPRDLDPELGPEDG
jgi:phosphohistidine phosphatase